MLQQQLIQDTICLYYPRKIYFVSRVKKKIVSSHTHRFQLSAEKYKKPTQYNI